MKTKEFFRRLYYFKTYQKLRSKGKNVRLSTGGLINRPSELSIGSNVFIAKGFVISARDMSIGDNVMVGPYLLAECDDHVFNVIGTTMYENRDIKSVSGITIESDVWIGGHVTILKGVRIGEGAVVGAGSVVTKSIPPYAIAFGNPCKVYKWRFKQSELKKHLNFIESKYTHESVIEFWNKYNL